MITRQAQLAFEKFLKDNPHYKGIYLGVESAGCNGFSYMMSAVPIEEKVQAIEMFMFGIPLYFLDEALKYYSDTTIDYKIDKFESGFEFHSNNPTCGCGMSFYSEK